MAKRGVYLDLQDRLLCNSVPEDNGYEIDGQPSECWVWLGNCDQKGYGRISMHVPGQNRSTGKRAHIVSHEFFLGVKLKGGMTLDHGCRVRRCIHPNHTTSVTRAENTRLMRHYWAKRSAEESGQQEIACA